MDDSDQTSDGGQDDIAIPFADDEWDAIQLIRYGKHPDVRDVPEHFTVKRAGRILLNATVDREALWAYLREKQFDRYALRFGYIDSQGNITNAVAIEEMRNLKSGIGAGFERELRTTAYAIYKILLKKKLGPALDTAFESASNEDSIEETQVQFNDRYEKPFPVQDIEAARKEAGQRKQENRQRAGNPKQGRPADWKSTQLRTAGARAVRQLVKENKKITWTSVALVINQNNPNKHQRSGNGYRQLFDEHGISRKDLW